MEQEAQNYYRRKNIFLLIAIIITVSLIVFLFLFGKGNSCESCMVHFKNIQMSGVAINDNELFIEKRMMDLYSNITENKCLVLFDRNRGYYES